MTLTIMDIVVFALMGLGILFAVIRMISGPKTGDRIVSLDTINMMVIGVIVLLASIFPTNGELYLDIAIIYGILAFLETVVFARYLEGRK